jgi:hypothetical protein
MISAMTELPNTATNVQLVQDFIDETRARIMRGVDITFTGKASAELKHLAIDHGITRRHIENAILNLSPQPYYRGIDPSTTADFEVCAFRSTVGNDSIEIYLKYGLEVNGLQILLFSSHEPSFTMTQPFSDN